MRGDTPTTNGWSFHARRPYVCGSRLGVTGAPWIRRSACRRFVLLLAFDPARAMAGTPSATKESQAERKQGQACRLAGLQDASYPTSIRQCTSAPCHATSTFSLFVRLGTFLLVAASQLSQGFHGHICISPQQSVSSIAGLW